MFYGTINETCDNVDYLEVELENSLLFFKSLDILEESGIQIVQEGAWETFKTKIKELWERFKNWVSSIWEKIKAIFTKKKSTIEKIKETNKKIKSSKDKVDESFSYIKEESKDSAEPKIKELKWYGRRKEGVNNFNDYTLALYGFGDKCLYPATLKDDESFNKFSNDAEAYKNKLDDYGTNLFFEEKTYKFKDEDILHSDGSILLKVIQRLGDEIVKDSEDLNDDIDAANILLEASEEKISKIEKEIFNIIKNNSDSEGNFVTIDGHEIPLRRFNQACALSINSLKSAISFLTRAITIINGQMGYNLRTMIQLSHSGRNHNMMIDVAGIRS